MADIMFSYPVYDDDQDSWYIRHVWSQDDGSYTDCDADGDHTDIEESEMNELSAQYDALWSEYAEWVVEKGEDPLGNFLVSPSWRVEEPWSFRIAEKDGRPVLAAAKPVKATAWRTQNWPKGVVDYCNLQGTQPASGTVNRLGDFQTVLDLIEVLEARAGRDEGQWHRNEAGEICFEDTIPINRPNRRYKQELRELARKSIIAKEVTK